MNLPIKRKIQVDIVTIFIFLIGIASIIIVFFNYHGNYAGIFELSRPLIDQTRNSVVQKISFTTNSAKVTTEGLAGMVEKIGSSFFQDKAIIAYMLNFMQHDEASASLSIATIEGDLLSAFDLTIANRHFYASRPTEPLPQGAKYAIRRLSRGTVASEEWEYFSTDLAVLATEKVIPVRIDPRSDPIFIEMENWPNIHWVYHYQPEQREAGLSVMMPIFNSQAQFFGSVTLDISLTILSNFVALEEMGKTGSAFLLDSYGTILLPTLMSEDVTTISKGVVGAAFSHYEKTHVQDFIFESEGIKYLASFTKFPLSLNTKWLIVAIVPFDDFFGPLLRTQYESLLISLAIVVICGILVFIASKHISRPIVQLAREVDKIQHFDLTEKEPLKTSIIELGILDFSITALQAALRSFQHYIPKEIVRTLIQKGKEIALGGERREVTILFSDIKDFTTAAEAMSIDQLTNALTHYFDVLSRIVLLHEGTIDKYIGDSLMCFWNAPQDVVDHATKACVSALLALKACRQMKEEGAPIYETRFGLHSGEVIVGNIGTAERMNYTVMGNVVNTASRLQTLNKDYQTSILISDTVHEKTGNQFVTRPIDFVIVKGKKNRIVVHELMALREEANAEQLELSKLFREGFELFYDEKIDEAHAIFSALQQKFPSDYPTRLYLERIQQFGERPADH